MRRTIRDRLFVGAHAPGSAYWAMALVGIAWALGAAALGDMETAVEGLVGAGVIISVVWLLSRVLRWSFWPWR